MSRSFCRRIFAVFYIALFVMYSLSVSTMAATVSFSIEDLFIYYETTELPSWHDLNSFYDDTDAVPSDSDSLNEYYKKRSLTESVIFGFKKGSTYNSFKSKLDKYCEFDSTYQELVPKGYDIDSDADEDSKEARKLSQEYATNQAKYEQVCKMFDSAMSKSAIRMVLDTSQATKVDNWFTRGLTNATNFAIGTFKSVMINFDKLVMTLAGGQFIIELVYISNDWSRGILGREWNLGFSKRTKDADSMSALPGASRTEWVQDHSKTFRVVGAAARAAVEREYVISDDLTSAVKNSVLLSFFMHKIGRIFLLIFTAVLIGTSAWESLCIVVLDAFSLFF